MAFEAGDHDTILSLDCPIIVSVSLDEKFSSKYAHELLSNKMYTTFESRSSHSKPFEKNHALFCMLIISMQAFGEERPPVGFIK